MTNKQLRGLQYLKRITKKLDEITYKELCIDLNDFFPSLPVSYFQTDKIKNLKETTVRDQSIIYRARENETYIPEKATLKLPFKNIEEISHIPFKKRNRIKSFGRCNKPKEARFYASSSFMTAAIEAITTGFVENPKSRGVTVGCWKIIEPLNLAQINYSIPSLKYFLQHDEEFYGKMIDYTTGLNDHHLNQIKEQNMYDPKFAEELMSILSDEFAKFDIKTDSDYMISNYYCDHIFERTFLDGRKSQIDGILYPSASLSYQEFNLCLHPRAMKKLKFLNAMMVWVVHHEKTKEIEYIPLEQNAFPASDETIEWKKFNW